MEILESIVKNNPCYTAEKRITVKGIVLHSVGCPQPSAEVFVKKFNSPASKVCVHAFIDGNTGKIYQTLPWDYKAWHCGGSGNSTHIGVEMCEPACIKYTGGATITCANEAAAKVLINRTLSVAVELFASLCKQYGLNPLGDGVIVSHKEGHDRGMASGHGDPDHLFNQLHMGYSMNDFRKAVAAAMGGAEMPASSAGAAIHEGDTVTLTPDAVYETGKGMPDWVKSDKWIIKSVNGDRVVIDKNASGTRAICSPVNVKYLTVVNTGAAPASQPAACAGEMNISDRGIELIAKYEGCRLEAYKCPAGVWTIGYGHTAGVNPGDKLSSQTAAKTLLKEDLKKYGSYVNSCVKKRIIVFALNQNQFDALTSFCYNCGNGSLQKLVNGRDAATIAEKLLQYNKGGGKALTGLTRRREEEKAIFLS